MAALLRWKNDQQQSLFDRINTESNQVDYRVDKNRLDSIKYNLSRILNSRPGGCQSAKSIGVVDLNDATVSASEIRAEVCRAIKDCIMQYEPRIVQVTVVSRTNENDALTMQFEILAVVKDELLGTDNVKFRMYIDNRQHYFFD